MPKQSPEYHSSCIDFTSREPLAPGGKKKSKICNDAPPPFPATGTMKSIILEQ